MAEETRHSCSLLGLHLIFKMQYRRTHDLFIYSVWELSIPRQGINRLWFPIPQLWANTAQTGLAQHPPLFFLFNQTESRRETCDISIRADVILTIVVTIL